PCQKPIWRQPKSDGSSQFHKSITTSPPMAMNVRMAKIASGAIHRIRFLLICSSSTFPELFVDSLQPLAQMQDRVAFARKQRIHAHAGVGRNFLETSSFQLVRDKCLALFLRQFVERQLDLIQKHVADVKRIGYGV